MTRDVIVDGHTLFVADPENDGVAADDDGGLYHRDARHLSALSTAIDGTDLVTLGRDVPTANRRTVVGTDLDSSVNRVDGGGEKRTDLVVRTRQTVSEDVGLTQASTVTNHSGDAFDGTLAVSFAADFADVFEVRGFSSGPDRDVVADHDGRGVQYTYRYETVDGDSVVRATSVQFDRDPTTLEAGSATFQLQLGPQESTRVTAHVAVSGGSPAGSGPGGPDSVPLHSDAGGGDDDRWRETSGFDTGRADYDAVFERAMDDFGALTTWTDHGPVPVAGAPWFATVFGRDSLIAAYQVLHVAPAPAAATLRYLAAHRGRAVDGTTEAAPGKIFHEIRHGELADRGLIPHTPYYGTIDATPLWVVLLAEHNRWTGDDALVRELADPLDAALGWIDEACERHGDDPFLYYERSPNSGLLHKAWRDTPGAVQGPDGERVDGPIASVDVQGYVYRAYRDAAALYEGVLGDPERAESFRERAERVATAFDREFWLPDREFYGLAKAGRGRIVETPTSNVGHCLWTGVVPASRAGAVARTLLSDAFFSGWGVRTMATTAAGYSPVSYHLGGVWPHDNSLVALGLARYGYHEETERLAAAVLDACTQFADERIPELFCGFGGDLGPVPYPASCVPQAWSAATPVALLRALFALSHDESGIDVGHRPTVVDRDALAAVESRWTN